MTDPAGDGGNTGLPVGDRGAINWLDRDVTIGTTNFRIVKLLPLQAYAALEMIRPALLKSVDANFGIGAMAVSTWLEAANLPADQTKTMLATALLNMPALQVEAVRQELFRRVYFTSETHPTQTPVAGNESAAFKGLRPSHIYEMFLRAGCVNFTESLADLIYLLSGGNPASTM